MSLSLYLVRLAASKPPSICAHFFPSVGLPGLLEVNLSPALSHSSRRQSAIISSMCEGLLRLTVDRIFPAPPPPVPEVHNDGTSFDSYTRTTSTDASSSGDDDARHLKLQRKKRARHFGKWRPITKKENPSKSSSHKRNNPSQTSSSPPSDTRGGGVRNPSAQVFSLTGRRLTRRTLARAERGVREATAAQALTVWWRLLADDCREARSRKLWTTARISAWATKIVARRRRRRALVEARSRSERSARVIQARWRQRRRNRRRAYRRVRRQVSSGLQSWARLVLSRRQDMARETILRAVAAAMTRHANKRHHAAAAAIVRGLETACDRRRQSRLRLQRFARTPCLLRVRLAALSLARVARVDQRVRNGAATILARALRRALARSAVVRAAFAARTLQSWYRTLLWRWAMRHTSAVTIQQAWRQRRIRRWLAEAEQPPSPKSAVITAATDASTATNTPACAVVPGKLTVAADGPAVLDPGGSQNVGQSSPRGGKKANNSSVPLAGHSSYASRLSPPDRPAAEDKAHIFRVPSVDGGGANGMSSALCDQLVSPATTARENWSDPDLCLIDGDGAQSCRGISHASRDGGGSSSGSLSDKETSCATATVTAAPRSPPLSGRSSTPRAAAGGTERRKETAPDESPPGGILDLEDILPDILKRRRRDKPWESTKPREATQQVMGIVRYRPVADGPRGPDHGRVTPPPAFCGRDERLPYPPAGNMHPIIDTHRAQCVTRRSARGRGGDGRVAGVATKPAPELCNHRNRKHRGEEVAGSFRCRSRPRNSGCRRSPKGDGHNYSSFGRGGTPATSGEFFAGPTGGMSSRSRVGPSSRRAGAKKSAKRGVGVRGPRDDLGSSVPWEAGGSGCVLGMLAFMEA